LIAALCYSAYILTLRKSQFGSRWISSLSTIALISLLTSLIMGIGSWAQKEGFFIPDIQSWGALVGYGFISQALGWVLIAGGLLKLETSLVGLILLLQPGLAFVWDVLFFARSTVTLEVLGVLIALFAIYIGTTSRFRSYPNEKST